MSFVVATFYHFFDFPDFSNFKQPLKSEMLRLDIKGSLLLASEGINGTLSGQRQAIDEFLNHLKASVIKGDMAHKESLNDSQPFKRAKVRLKKETISLGEEVNPRLTGQHVDAKDWNALIADPDTIVLDARNSYEVHLGTFERAIDPKTKNFKQLPGFIRHHLENAKDKKIATFCTGGIRCEKLSAWMIQEGFQNVYQLNGGILKYLEEVPAAESKWQGECYVFDERIAVGHGLKPSESASMCRACGHALTPEDRQHRTFREGKACRFCADSNV